MPSSIKLGSAKHPIWSSKWITFERITKDKRERKLIVFIRAIRKLPIKVKNVKLPDFLLSKSEAKFHWILKSISLKSFTRVWSNIRYHKNIWFGDLLNNSENICIYLFVVTTAVHFIILKNQGFSFIFKINKFKLSYLFDLWPDEKYFKIEMTFCGFS